MNAAPTVVICRPPHQARATVDLLQARGVDCVVLPLLEIVAKTPDDISLAAIQRAAHNNAIAAVIAVSQNAAEHGARYLPAAEFDWIAVGQSTKARLQTHGIGTVIAPVDGEDSEGVLRLRPLQSIHDKTIVLLRGDGATEASRGGRKLLATTLRERGALVIELVCYQRHRLTLDAQSRMHWQTLMRKSANLIWVLGSVETLDSWIVNLVDAALADGWQRQSLLVPHRRVAEAARLRGFGDVTVCSLQPAAILHALTDLTTQRSNDSQ